MKNLQYDSRIRVAGPGDGAGMGETVQLTEFFGGYGGGLGREDLATIVTKEQPGFRLTELVLTNFVLPITSITTGIGVGGVQIYSFPAGVIQRYSCKGLLSATVETQADVTDSTPEGDIGIGTLAPADADALGTDATDDDWGTATAYDMVAYADASIVIPTEAAGTHDGTSTPVDLFLNGQIDAADIDNGITTNLLISGKIWFLWANLGGV